MNKKILIVAGDPNSVNSEIIYKVWKKVSKNIKRNLYLVANYNLYLKQFKKLKLNIDIVKVKNINDSINSLSLKIIDVPVNFKDPFKVSLKESSKYVIKSLNLAHSLVEDKSFKAVINCPINKNLIKFSGKIGVTEFFASKCKVKKSSEVMFIHNKRFSVVPLTTHLDIKDVSKNITSHLIISKLQTLNKDFKRLFKFIPKIGVLGLNPHNSEYKITSKEVSTIRPSILKLKRKGFKIEGPLVSDTIFINKYKNYDVIVGMYHDQVLAPFKTIFKFDAINITLGLNYLRVSPDHGPATELIGKNKADHTSLFQCIKFVTSKT
tara:strand:+ start:379 stop:1344 length:966 start_codon:yes stop_codon:yes gene_type:complete